MFIPQQHYIEDDVVLVHKPSGMSSFDLLRKLWKVLGTKKLGHAGTLDPRASGLMIVGINSGTKKLDQYLKLPKTYIAEVFLGISTETGDLEGEVVESKVVYPNDFKGTILEDAVASLVGSHEFPVPLYSAIKVDGKPLYWYARNGQEPPRIPVKPMTVTKIQLLDQYRSGDGYVLSLRMDVDSGTYVRTLAEELGKRLGYPATLRKLYRLSIGDFQDQDAFRLD